MVGDTCVEVITLDESLDVNDCFTAEFVATLIEITYITSGEPVPGVGWTYGTDGWAPPLETQGHTKEALKNYAAWKRAQIEALGVEVSEGVTLRTDTAARVEITIYYLAAQYTPTLVLPFKLLDGTFVTLNADGILTYAQAMWQFLLLSNQAEATCVADIDAETITNTWQIDVVFTQVHL